MQQIKNLSEAAKILMESDARFDQDIGKMTVLFPLLETLGYDATKTGDILLNPAYNNDGTYKMDYGLRGEGEDVVKTMIKMIEFDAEPGLEFSNIRQCIIPGSLVEYIITTDCFNYYIYANAEEGLTFIDVVSFNICNVNASQIRSFSILKNPSVNSKQNYALDNDEDMETEDENTSVENKYLKPSSIKTSKSTKPTETTVTSYLMPIISGSICVILLITAALFGFAERENVSNWHNVTFSHDNVMLNYHSLKGNVNITTYENRLNVVKVSITGTNLPANTNVTLVLKNDVNEKSHTVNVLTDSTGSIVQDISLPPSWTANANISLKASLVFDNYQTVDATNKYGQYGQYIVTLTGEKNVIGTSSTYYDHDAIQSLIAQQEAEKQAAELKAIREYFSNYTIVKYSNGDMCFYPKGYNTDDWDTANDNINSTDKSYAKIYYSAATQTGKFYYITGTFMSSASWPAGVFTLSDTVNSYDFSIKNGRFKYHMNKYSSVTGWCQFDQEGISNLIPILTQIYSSDAATIEFKNLHKVSISSKDKNAVLSMIDLYTKYFANGSISMNPEWFQSN